jgi:uncharacterized protein (DUF983 family)
VFVIINRHLLRLSSLFSLDSGAYRSGDKAPPTKRLTAADNDRPENSSPGTSLPWNAPEGLHLLDAVTPDSCNPSATPTVQPTHRWSRTGTIAISSLKSNCQEKGAEITSVCAFYFGRAAGSGARELMRRVNTPRPNPQTRCEHQAFPDFVLTAGGSAAPAVHRSRPVSREPAIWALAPDTASARAETSPTVTLGEPESEPPSEPRCFLRRLPEQLLSQVPNASFPTIPDLQSWGRAPILAPIIMVEDAMPDISRPVAWRPSRAPDAAAWPVPSMRTAILRGVGRHCPSCGRTALFTGYLKVAQSCTLCGAPLALYPSDDTPPYITMLLVLHVVVPLLLILEQTTDLPLWLYGAIVLPLATILTAVLLPMVKGGMIGVLFKLGADRKADDGDTDGAAWQ